MFKIAHAKLVTSCYSVMSTMECDARNQELHGLRKSIVEYAKAEVTRMELYREHALSEKLRKLRKDAWDFDSIDGLHGEALRLSARATHENKIFKTKSQLQDGSRAFLQIATTRWSGSRTSCCAVPAPAMP